MHTRNTILLLVLGLFAFTTVCLPALAAEKAAKPAGKPAATKSSKGDAKPAAKSTGKPAAKAKGKKEEPAPEKLPWSLRDRYTFPGGPFELDFSKEDGEWRITGKKNDNDLINIDLLVKDVGFSIELVDGRTLRYDEICFPKTTLDRVKFTTEGALGGGTAYTVHYPVKDGLTITSRLRAFDGWPFLTMTLIIQNDNPEPLKIRRIIAASFGPGSICGLSPETKVRTRGMQVRGGYPVLVKDRLPLEMMFTDPKRGSGFSIGIIPSGRSETGVDIQPAGGAWQGRIASEYGAGGVTVKTGEAFEADSLWISLGVKPFVTDNQYSWTFANVNWPKNSESSPRAWVTIPDTEGLSALVNAGRDAQAFGVFHALIPGNWEGKPGSLEGGSPKYPKDIEKAAKELRGVGCTPGLTVDPLLVQGGSNAFTVQSSDGQTWANPAHPDGASFLLKRMQKLVSGNFGFIVVERSHIPDEVLTQFGISRGEADWRAIGAVSAAAAARKVAVYPASEITLKGERDAWLEAAACTARMGEYSVGVGPARLDAAGLSKIDPELATALRIFPGPVEIVGSPGAGARSALAGAFSGDIFRARPQDTDNRAPLLWETRIYAQGIGWVGTNLIRFSGAPEANLKDIDTSDEGATFAWQPDGDSIIVPANGVLAAASKLSVMGLCPELNRPTFMGVSHGLTLGLDKLRNLAWDEQKGKLTGSVDDSFPASTRAYVALTPGWKAKTVKVGSARVKPSAMDAKWLVFPMTGGPFEIEFEKAK